MPKLFFLSRPTQGSEACSGYDADIVSDVEAYIAKGVQKWRNFTSLYIEWCASLIMHAIRARVRRIKKGDITSSDLASRWFTMQMPLRIDGERGLVEE